MPAGRPPQAVLSADFMRREHSAPTVTYSDGGSMSMASRAGRPSLPKKIALMAGANSEPASMQPQISSQTGVQVGDASVVKRV